MKIKKVNFPPMKKVALILVLNVLLLQGCGGGGGNTATNTEGQPPPPTNTATPPTPPPTNPTNDGSDMLANNPNTTTKSSPVVPGLIPVLNPQKRQQQSIKGRSDPFGLVNIAPTSSNPLPISLPTKPPVKQGGNNKGGSGVTKSGVHKGGVSKGGTIKSPTKNLEQNKCPQGKNCISKGSNPDSTKYEPPPPPEPTEAKSVFVSGIVNIQGKNVAIVRTTDYNYSYSVSEGTTLYNGQVLVKKINSLGSDPSVTLEQYGQEIVKLVGDQAEGVEKSDNNVSYISLKNKPNN